MTNINIGGSEIKVNDEIEFLKVRKYQKFNEYVAIEAGIGSDMEAVDSKFIDIMQMIDKGDKAKAKQALMNMRQAIQFVVENISPKSLAFASMIHSIDGVVVDLRSDDELRETVAKLSDRGLTMSIVFHTVYEIKKKLRTSWRRIFRPSRTLDLVPSITRT